MDSELLKTEILKHFRFKKQYIICGTEVNNGIEIADVLLSNGNNIIEIEIKISYSDFLADFKKRKHIKNKNGIRFFLYCHKFYYCVPAEIKEKCLNYLKENNYKYGLYCFNGELTLIKKCSKLQNLTMDQIGKINDYIIRRATSELVNLRIERKHNGI